MGGITPEKIDQLKSLQQRLHEEFARGAVIALPKQEGPTWDGENTTRLMVRSLTKFLQPITAAQNHIRKVDAWAEMEKVRTQIFTLLNKLKQQAIIPPTSIGETPLLSDLQRWLIGQRLPVSMGDRSKLSADEYPPSVIVPSDAPGYTLTATAAIWMEGGISRALNLPPPRRSRLDRGRGELRFDQPYVLHIWGALSPSDVDELSRALANSSQALLIVLADAIDLVPPALLEARLTLVFPAPQQAGLLGAAPALAVGRGWSLGRWRAAQIDQRRALLVMPQDMPESGRAQSRSADGWDVCQVLLLQVPKARKISLVEAEMAMRWRIDAASGLIASGGAGLAWLAMQLDTRGDPYAQAWRSALLSPMLQILQNLMGASQGWATFPRLVHWVAQGASPDRAYYIPAGQAGAQDPQIQRGHYLALGSLLPLGQVEHMLRQAFDLTMKQLSIDTVIALTATQPDSGPLDTLFDGLESAGNILNLALQQGKARIGQLPQNTALPKFYMARPQGKPPVPAAGMYYYSEAHGMLREHVIGFDGLPKAKRDHLIGRDGMPKAQKQRMLPATMIADLAVDDQPPRGHWVLDLGSSPPSYLATCPLDANPDPKDPPLALRNERLVPLSQGRGLVLPRHLRASLAHMLHHRRRQGYLTVWDNMQLGQIDEQLCENTEPFWDMIRIVSQKLVAAIQRDLQAEPGEETFFNNPDLIFHLNRKLSEGFIEGHAAQYLIPPGGYDPCAASVKSWAEAIQYASGRKQITYNNLRRQEKEIFDLLWQSALQSRPPRGAKGQNSLTHFFSLATPGIGEAQNIIFWSMHYPHWNQDLVYVLRDLASVGLYLDDGDLRQIAELIVESLAETRAERLAAIIGVLTWELTLPTVTNLMRRLTRYAGADRLVLAPVCHLWQVLLGRIVALLFDRGDSSTAPRAAS